MAQLHVCSSKQKQNLMETQVKVFFAKKRAERLILLDFQLQRTSQSSLHEVPVTREPHQ